MASPAGPIAPALLDVLSAVARTAARLCEGRDALILLVEGDSLRVVAQYGTFTGGRRVGDAYPLGRDTPLGRALLEQRMIHVRDMAMAVRTRYPALAPIQRRAGTRTVLHAPMLVAGTPVGGIVIRRTVVRPFTARQIALLKTFADQAALAIENARLSEQLQARNRALTETLEQQTATSEILRVISGSPTELQPVLDAVAENAARVCGADDAVIQRVEGDLLRRVAHFGSLPVPGDTELMPIRPDWAAGQAVLECRTVHVPDMLEEHQRGHYPGSVAHRRRIGHRTFLVTPLVREGAAIGTIVIRRLEMKPFTDKQIALLQTFADQAVIAIENVRLFTELQARNRQLSEALEQQTATSEILRVISGSPTDIQPILDAVVHNAARLCDAKDAQLFRIEGGVLRLAASFLGDVPVSAEVRAHGVPLQRGTVTGRSVLDRRPIHVHDIVAELDTEFPGARVFQQATGMRTVLAVPLLRENDALGVILIRRFEVRPFSETQIALLQTFADQAVIAIENVRLFTELQSRNRALTEALEQQTATSEILRVISGSPTDVQPVFDAIVRSAVRLCDGLIGAVFQFDGRLIHLVAHHNFNPEGLAAAQRRYPLSVEETEAEPFTRVFQEQTVLHMPDIVNDPRTTPGMAQVTRALGSRSHVVVPMLRERTAIGAIIVGRREPTPFGETQIDLLQTFADQAVIAIENVRLFKELQARNSELTEALEQQTATAEILRSISSSPTDTQPIFDVIVRNAVRLCGALYGLVFRHDAGLLHLVAHHNLTAEQLAEYHRVFPRPGTASPLSRTAMTGHVLNIPDVESYPEAPPDSLALWRSRGVRSILSVPLRRQAEVVGQIGVSHRAVDAFTDSHVELLKTFADQAVIAIENVRLFKELEERNRDLTDALARQTATAEVLRVISRSQTDVRPVFGAILESAVRLCAADIGGIFKVEDGRLVPVEVSPSTPDVWTIIRLDYPRAVDTTSLVGRTAVEARVIHVPDTEVPTAPQGLTRQGRALGFRSQLSVPMIRDGQPIGVMALTRRRPGPFSEAEIDVVQTFADQAVIAIENARLLNELQARTAQLTRSVEQLTALGDVGRALSSTLDLETVLQTIVARANQLAGTDACSVFEYDEATEEFRLRATNNLDEEVVAVARRSPIRKGEGAQGRMAITRVPVQIPDIAAGDAYRGPLRDILLRAGTRSLLAIPLLREDHLVGSLTVNRKTPGEFPAETIDLLQTFATQSALAIQNARLFREIEAKSHQLEVASRHKSQFLANMSHELRTPLNAILGYTELISDNIYGEVPERMREVLDRVEKSGRHLLGLINDILDLSKIEAGQLTLNLTDYAMQDVVRSVAAATEPLAKGKGLSLEVAMPDDLPIGRADERRLMQVLLNLVGNAIKFTEAGHVSIRAEACENVFRVAVTDTGPGIAEGDREKIFEEFQQADSAVARTKGGTGLGLAIARRIIEMHGGRLWLDSTLGVGSTFSFTVPTRVEQPVTTVSRRPS